MRRRRGEPSLFEILRDPAGKSGSGTQDSSAESTDSSPPSEAAQKGFWAKVKGLRTSEEEDAARTGRGTAPERSEVPGSRRFDLEEPSAADRGSPPPEREASGVIVDPSVPRARETRVRRSLPPLPQPDWSLEEGEEERPEGLVAWLNRTAEVRYSTFMVFTVGVILATILAYVSGTRAANPAQEAFELQRSMDRAAWDADEPGPVLHTFPGLKKPLKKIESKTPVPRPERVGGGESTREEKEGGGPAPEEKPPQPEPQPQKKEAPVPGSGGKYGIRVCQTDDVEGADKLVVELRRHEVDFGVQVLVRTHRGAKGRMLRVYFGPFATYAEASALLPRIQKLRSFRGTDFGDSYIEKLPPSKRTAP